MDPRILLNKFEAMGARLKLQPATSPNRMPAKQTDLTVDIDIDRRGEFYVIRHGESVSLEIVDLRPRDRHLLMLARTDDVKDKFLCGHDERHWFVAAVPNHSGVTSVRTAMDALKPHLVRRQEQIKRVAFNQRFQRRNDAFVRQGEWFFVPDSLIGRTINPRLVLRDEPISRGRGKPHLCQYLYREGGTEVYVCVHRPAGLVEEAYQTLLRQKPKAKDWNWQKMRLNPTAYVRGSVSHADHATIYLDGWHRVLMNTEGEARASKKVVFLD